MHLYEAKEQDTSKKIAATLTTGSPALTHYQTTTRCCARLADRIAAFDAQSAASASFARRGPARQLEAARRLSQIVKYWMSLTRAFTEVCEGGSS